MNSIESDEANRHWLERLPIARGRPWVALSATLAIISAALLLRILVAPALSGGFPFITFFPVVIVTSALFGTWIGLFATVMCGVLAWYLFIGPPFSFALGTSEVTALTLYALVSCTCLLIIHLMQRTNATLAREREVSRSLAQTSNLLFRELQHRVSNNLQVAAGLLMLQKRQIADPDARLALDEAARRLAVIGRISRQLYDPDGGARGMRAFLEDLCKDVLDASGRSGVALRVHAAHDQALPPDSAIPLALIVAESVANAIEHGFAGRDRGIIEIELSRNPDYSIQVDVRDDGNGLPDGFDIDQCDSLGLRIAGMLATQLGGQFSLCRDSGTTARLILPA